MMNNLSSLFKEFDGRGLSEDQLTNKFEEIASRQCVYRCGNG